MNRRVALSALLKGGVAAALLPVRGHAGQTFLQGDIAGEGKDDPAYLYYNCKHWLTGHIRSAMLPHHVFRELATYTDKSIQPDAYGNGKLIADFEKQIAELLGKEAAVFMPGGTMCQPLAMRIWAERKNCGNIAFHPTCHLEIHEYKAYEFLHGLKGITAGSRDKVITLQDVKNIAEPLAVLLLELPQREIGGQLPSWDELKAISEWARSRKIAVHLDGARLWECQPYYKKSYKEICSLFDTVYVSTYKGVGGITGAVLTGPASFIKEAKVWQRRQGGNLYQMYPYILSAQKGLSERLPKMEAYYRKALEVAAVFKEFSQMRLVPDIPVSNMFHCYIEGDKAKINKSVLSIAQEQQVWSFAPMQPTLFPQVFKFEFYAGDATLGMSNQLIRRVTDSFFRKMY